MTLTDSQYKTLLDAAAALKLVRCERDEVEMNAARYGALMAIGRFLDKHAEMNLIQEIRQPAPF